MPSSESLASEQFLAARRSELLGRIRAAAKRAGRDPAEVTLCAVSKTVGVPEVVAAMRAGYTVFAENRPQELSRKLASLSQADVELPRFDLIGNLQTNKINQVLASRPALIHSISSLHLAQAISKRAAARDLRVRVLLEVNVSGEQSKSGFSAAEVRQAFQEILSLEALEVCGLMTMAPAHDPSMARRTFCGLRELARVLERDGGVNLPVLSCGMSDDYEIAVEEGSTLVRLGRIVFSPNYALPGAEN